MQGLCNAESAIDWARRDAGQARGVATGGPRVGPLRRACSCYPSNGPWGRSR